MFGEAQQQRPAVVWKRLDVKWWHWIITPHLAYKPWHLDRVYNNYRSGPARQTDAQHAQMLIAQQYDPEWRHGIVQQSAPLGRVLGGRRNPHTTTGAKR